MWTNSCLLREIIDWLRRVGGLRSSGMLCGVGSKVSADVSGLSTDTIFRGAKNCLSLEEVADILSRTVGNQSSRIRRVASWKRERLLIGRPVEREVEF